MSLPAPTPSGQDEKIDPTQWRNRIVGHGDEDPRQIMANPFNFRVHGKLQKVALAGSIHSLGIIQTVLKNVTTGHLIDGHLRVGTAVAEHQKSIPVTYVELTQEEEAQALLSLDPIAAMASTDRANMEHLLQMVSTDNAAVMDFLTTLAANNRIDWGNPDEAGPEINPDLAAALQLKWDTEAGQMWGIGKTATGYRHKIICGDSRDAGTVARLLGDERIDQLNTDPPYGVDLVSKDGFYKDMGTTGSTSGAMLNDDIKDYRSFFGDFLKLIPFAQTNTVYIFMQRRRISELFAAMEDAGIYVSEDLVWVKSSPVFGRQDYHHQHEWIVYGWHGRHEFYRNASSTLADFAIDPETMDRDALLKIVKQIYETADIIREKKQSKNTLHPTMKPPRLVQRLILDGTRRNAIIYDPFSGSATTPDAAENTHRQSRAVELDPKYVAVWLERMSTKMDETPERIP